MLVFASSLYYPKFVIVFFNKIRLSTHHQNKLNQDINNSDKNLQYFRDIAI